MQHVCVYDAMHSTGVCYLCLAKTNSLEDELQMEFWSSVCRRVCMHVTWQCSLSGVGWPVPTSLESTSQPICL